MPVSIAVVGAGMAGLSAACRLARAGARVVVFDKGRGVAGRTSTRHAEGGRAFDHGAQYFTASDPRFRARVDGWLESGVVAEWSGRLAVAECGPEGCRLVDPPGSKTRYVGAPGMNAMGRAMAEEAIGLGAEVRSRVCVAPPEWDGDGWRLTGDDGAELGVFDRLLVTAPAPQAAELLRGGTPALAEAAASVRMTGCWAVMVAFAERFDAGMDGLFVNGPAEATPLSWAARNGSKPGRPAGAEAGDYWVLHGSPEWSEANLEADPSGVVPMLVEGLAAAVGRPAPAVAHGVAHRWRYALPQNPLEERYLADEARGVFAAGDWCGGPKVEGAYLGGLEAAEAMVSRL